MTNSQSAFQDCSTRHSAFLILWHAVSMGTGKHWLQEDKRVAKEVEEIIKMRTISTISLLVQMILPRWYRLPRHPHLIRFEACLSSAHQRRLFSLRRSDLPGRTATAKL